MKKFLSFILILTMILSVSGVALAAECNDSNCDHVAAIGEEHYDTLQAAINAAKNGDTITLLADCAENVTVTQAPDVKITIDGNNKSVTMSGSITVDGKNAAYATAGLTIQNVKFDASGISKDASINLGVKGDNNTRYVSNLTVEGCKFTGNGQSKAAIKSYTGGDKNLKVIKCEVDNTMHSLLQVDNVAGLIIDNCTVNSKNGINLNSSSNVEIKNSNISVKGYAVRMGPDAEKDAILKLTLTNNTLATDDFEGDPTIVLRGTAAAQADLDMTKNVVSGKTHISGVTDSTDISANANYWDGKPAPVVPEGGAPVEVDTYYEDEDLTELIAHDAINLDISKINFDPVKEGYTGRPEPKTVKVKYFGNKSLKVEPKDTTVGGAYDISEVEKTAENQYRFTVQPKAKLPKGEYKVTLIVSEYESSAPSASPGLYAMRATAGGIKSAEVEVSFVVTEPDNEPAPKPTVKPTEKPASSGIKVEYEGGNSFSTSKSAVPTSVEIDGVPVSFTGDGNSFTVSDIPAGAKWITVRWNSTSITINFTPDGNVVSAGIEIPKTRDASILMPVLMIMGAAAIRRRRSSK